MKRSVVVWIRLTLCYLASLQLAYAETTIPASLQVVFFPYRTGSPQIPGITAGMTIDQQSWQVAEPVLPTEILNLVRAGDFTIAVQDTTDLPPRSSYIAATAQHFQAVSLNGERQLTHYQGGLPFPVLNSTDPQAGGKAIWNFRYRDVPKTLELGATMRGINNAGTITRTNIGRMRMRYGMYRVGDEDNDREWEERGVYMKATFRLLAPADQEGMMRVMTIYDDDTQTQEDMSYNPQNRRIRKSYANLLARMGGGRYDVLMEEQPPLFFVGYLHEYSWTYRGERVMLVPGFLRADHVPYGGKNNWYPNVPWELRQVLVLESTPKRGHPFGKRIFYIDSQNYTPFYVLTYDSQGTFVRVTLNVHGNPDFVPGAQGVRLPVPLSAAWINVVQNDASQFVAGKPIFNGKDSPRRFELMELLRRGK